MEYWITEHGDYTFCDGDAGIDIPNHEMVVTQECFTKLIDIWASHNDPLLEQLVALAQPFIESDEGFTDTCMFRTTINDSIDDWLANDTITGEESDDIYGTILNRLRQKFSIAELLSMKYDEVLHIALGHYDGDPRQFAVVNWNWIRVIHKNFDIKQLTRETASRIQDFIESDEGQDISHRLYKTEEWTIEIQEPKHVCIQTERHFDYKYLRHLVTEKLRRRELAS